MRNDHQRILILLVIFLTLFAGCGKDEASSQDLLEATQQITSMPTETIPTFDYGPDPWAGCYIMATPNMEADPEVLDSISFELPEGFTRYRVSECQIDIVKNGAQVGGILLVDIPTDMLQQAAESKAGLFDFADLLAKQVMPDIYPSRAFISGGGDVLDTNYYLAVFIKTNMENGLVTQYMHHIYVGEQYCYDFWIDEGLWNDTGVSVSRSLTSKDIKPELNDVEFAWGWE